MSDAPEPNASESPRPSLIKPTLDTPFHIDFSWWRQNDREWLVFLRGLLGEEQEAHLAEMNMEDRVDWVDPHTGEVTQMDLLQYLLSQHYAQQGEQGASMVESIFRVFLKNGNSAMSARQLGEALSRPPQTILRTLAGARVYRGIRPVGA
ncbi:MAG: hypothetical protein WEA61_07435 [Anaerolineales bacterium]